LKQELGIEAELIPSGGGAFEVEADGKLLFSKHETGRFPDPGEVAQLLGGKV